MPESGAHIMKDATILRVLEKLVDGDWRKNFYRKEEA
jgi:hypothetical protein